MNLSEYGIFTHPDLQKSLDKNLPECFRKVFDRKMAYFAKNFHHPSLNTKKYNTRKQTLKRLGIDEVWEFYINRKDYRCIFYVIHEEKKIIIVDVGKHSQLERRHS